MSSGSDLYNKLRRKCNVPPMQPLTQPLETLFPFVSMAVAFVAAKQFKDGLDVAALKSTSEPSDSKNSLF